MTDKTNRLTKSEARKRAAALRETINRHDYLYYVKYDHWRGPFYPESMPKKQWFGYYCRHFDTVVINRRGGIRIWQEHGL